MDLEEILDMSLRDILDKYCAVYNLECGYYYGVSEFDSVDELFEKYNIEEEYPEAFYIEPIVNQEILDNFDELLSYEKMVKIMDNLGINLKTK